jgi:predicted metal-binding protein
MTTVITVCDTCRTEGTEKSEDSTIERDGAKFATLIEAASVGNPNVSVRRHSCLMGCQGGCNVALQAEGKLTYVLGRFEPCTEAASGIVEYATMHDQSALGQVPFKQWPVAIKGHFVTRIPVLDSTDK